MDPLSGAAEVAPSIPQIAIAAYLQEGGYDRQLRRLRRTCRENQARTLAAIGRHFPPGTRATQPRSSADPAPFPDRAARVFRP